MQTRKLANPFLAVAIGHVLVRLWHFRYKRPNGRWAHIKTWGVSARWWVRSPYRTNGARKRTGGGQQPCMVIAVNPLWPRTQVVIKFIIVKFTLDTQRARPQNGAGTCASAHQRTTFRALKTRRANTSRRRRVSNRHRIRGEVDMEGHHFGVVWWVGDQPQVFPRLGDLHCTVDLALVCHFAHVAVVGTFFLS